MWSPDMQTALNGLVLALLTGLTLLIKSGIDGLGRDTKAVKHEVTHNSGSSTKDAVARTENETKFQTNIMREIQRDIGGIREELRIQHKSIEDMRNAKNSEHERIFDALERLENHE